MSEAVTVPSLMMITLKVSEESLAKDRHTDRQAHPHKRGLVYFTFFKMDYDFENKMKKKTKKKKKNSNIINNKIVLVQILLILLQLLPLLLLRKYIYIRPIRHKNKR